MAEAEAGAADDVEYEEFIIEADPNAKYGIIPAGLEYLVSMEAFYVNDEKGDVEALSSFACNNRYSIMDAQGQRIYYAAESFPPSGICSYLMTKYRPFEIKLVDAAGVVVISLSRKSGCGLYCCPYCYGNSVEIRAAVSDELLGSAAMACSIGRPTVQVLNHLGQIVFIVLGPKNDLGGIPTFEIMKPDGTTVVGYVTKFSDLDNPEVFPEPAYFGARFPGDVNPKSKTLLLGAAFLINFNRFQKT